MELIVRKRYCHRCCDKVYARLVRNITASGVSQVYWLCIKGQHTIAKPGTDWIGHEKIKSAGINIDDIPVRENYSGREVCAVCGSPFAERHHWAPWHLFPDADQWPQDYLCKEHHVLWHSLVTPDMAKVRV